MHTEVRAHGNLRKHTHEKTLHPHNDTEGCKHRQGSFNERRTAQLTQEKSEAEEEESEEYREKTDASKEVHGSRE